MSAKTASEALNKAGAGIDDELKAVLARHRSGPSARMYDMLGYFFGFLDEDLKPMLGVSSGKRFRPALCLLIAEGYLPAPANVLDAGRQAGGAREKALDAALAIEFFHNFTLIHDDIEDHDEYRRERPTLWKLFGVNHAMNAGDALSLMACDTCAGAGPAAMKKILAAFAEVIEGQHMDFELASEPIDNVTIERYMLSTEKKTGALIGVAAEAAGIAAAQSEAECVRLRSYGRLLGTAFQLADDYRSVWSSYEETGKDAHSDIRERKRTLPFLFAYEETQAKARLSKLFNVDRQLSITEIDEVRSIVEASSARTRVLQMVREHAEEARAAAETLSLPERIREILKGLVDVLVPEAGTGFSETE